MAPGYCPRLEGGRAAGVPPASPSGAVLLAQAAVAGGEQQHAHGDTGGEREEHDVGEGDGARDEAAKDADAEVAHEAPEAPGLRRHEPCSTPPLSWRGVHALTRATQMHGVDGNADLIANATSCRGRHEVFRMLQ